MVEERAGRWQALAALACLFLSAPAWSQECLSDASVLGDRRALTSLRDAVEASCPCEPAAGRRLAYQRCARRVVEQAVSAGELRRECRGEAYEDSFRTVCGTRRVACGQFDPDASEPVRCRLSVERQCADRGPLHQEACTTQTHCADVVDWTAGTCVDPRQRGPFNAGVQVIRLVKQSEVHPEAERVLDTVVWYPASPGGTVDPVYAAVVDAPIDDAEAPYPLVMFSHGSCGAPTQSRFLTPLLASYGFVVVAPPHPGNTLPEFPRCGLPATQIDSVRERPQDVIFAIDQMLAMNADLSSDFFGSIDPDRIGMSGHSFGGTTTYLVAGQDARIKTASPFAPQVIGNPVLRIPSLNMLGQIDSRVNVPNIRSAYARAMAPKILVEIENAGHYAWSDLCFPSPDCNPPTTLSQPEANDTVLRWVLPFLKFYLAGDESYAPFFADVPPGVVVQEDLGGEP